MKDRLKSILHNNQAIIITCLIIIIASVILQLNILINPDSAWHLHVAGQLLAGKKLYIDIIEVNFPFIYYFRMIPHLIQKISGISYITISIWLNIAITIFGFLLTLNILKYSEYSKSALAKNSLIIGICFGMFILPFTMTQNFFGEKEQLIVAVLTPYIFSALTNNEYYSNTRPKRFIIAILAALGMCIKPMYAIVFITVEIYLFFNKKNIRSFLRLEPVTIAITGIIYLILICTITPQFFASSLFTSNLYSSSPWYFFFLMPFTSIHALFLLFVVLTLPSCRQYAYQKYLFIIFLACLATASTHLKSNDYYFYPAMFFALLLFSIPLGDFFTSFINAIKSTDKISKIRKINYYSFSTALFITPYVVFVTTLGTINLLGNHVMDDYCGFTKLKQYIDSYGSRQKVAVFGNLPDAFPLINYTNSEYTLRHSGTWMLCGISHLLKTTSPDDKETMQKLEKAEDFYINGIIEDFRKNTPEIVIISMAETKDCMPVTEFTKKNRDFIKIWQNYSLSATINPDSKNHTMYRIYTRK